MERKEYWGEKKGGGGFPPGPMKKNPHSYLYQDLNKKYMQRQEKLPPGVFERDFLFSRKIRGQCMSLRRGRNRDQRRKKPPPLCGVSDRGEHAELSRKSPILREGGALILRGITKKEGKVPKGRQKAP